ncbi:MAG TPA: DUF4350 domain-containing protein [Bacteroidia bacterium]|jgi:hypothetical protein
MNKQNRKYIIILTLCFTALITIQFLAPKPVSWKPSYTKKDKIPFGTSALYDMLPVLFEGQTIIDKTMPLYNSMNIEGKGYNYIFINNEFSPDTLDLRELNVFVENGNSVFIAANSFEGKFASGLKTGSDEQLYSNIQALNDSGATIFKNNTRLNFVNPILKSTEAYDYSKACKNSYFTFFDTSKTTVLGVNSQNEVNFISIRRGKGMFYISTVPEAFSNYHFASTENNSYACKALSYLPLQTTFWDEYYKAGRILDPSPLRVIFRHRSLMTAYYLLIVSLLIFMIIGIKRKQRIIPVWPPLKNTTLEFVDVVGTLYYQSGNHKNIAGKKINYFLEHIRSRFFIQTSAFDPAFIERISNLSGIEMTKITELFEYITQLSGKSKISQEELILLNKRIEEFHQLNKR